MDIVSLLIEYGSSFNRPFDGIMGTARSSLSSQKLLTPIESLAKAGALSGAFIGYSLGRVSDDKNIGVYLFFSSKILTR